MCGGGGGGTQSNPSTKTSTVVNTTTTSTVGDIGLTGKDLDNVISAIENGATTRHAVSASELIPLTTGIGDSWRALSGGAGAVITESGRTGGAVAVAGFDAGADVAQAGFRGGADAVGYGASAGLEIARTGGAVAIDLSRTGATAGMYALDKLTTAGTDFHKVGATTGIELARFGNAALEAQVAGGGNFVTTSAQVSKDVVNLGAKALETVSGVAHAGIAAANLFGKSIDLAAANQSAQVEEKSWLQENIWLVAGAITALGALYVASKA